MFIAIGFLLIYVGVNPVYAQNDEYDESRILRIVEAQNTGDIDMVKNWLESNESQKYPDLRLRANNWINQTEEQNKEIKEEYDGGTTVISDGLIIKAYEFNESKEQVNIVFKADSRRIIGIADIGSALESGNGELRSVTVQGTQEVTMEAKEVDRDFKQAVSISDNTGGGFGLIKASSKTDVFGELKWWYIPLSALIGALTLAILTIRFINKREDEGKGEIKPMGGSL